MRKIFIILLVMGCAFSAYSQTFPSKDSLRNYANKWIRNSAVTAFTNLRLNVTLNGIIDYLDSTSSGSGGIDTIFVGNKGTGVNMGYASNDSLIFKTLAVSASFTFTTGADSTNNLALATTGVTAASYTNANITVNAFGQITAAANGSGLADGDKGDVTVSGSGATWTIDNNVVSNAKFRQSAGLSVVANATNSTANVADLTAGTDKYVLKREGTALVFGLLDSSNVTGLHSEEWYNTKYALIGSGGSGTSVSNVGSGFRVLGSPGAQTLRTIFPGSGILVDSTSNTDGLTFSWAQPIALGDFYRAESFASVDTFTNVGATASAGSNVITLSGGTNDHAKVLKLKDTSMLKDWSIRSKIVVDAAPTGTTYGYGIGKFTSNSWSGPYISADINLTNTVGALGKVTIYNGGALATSTAGISFSSGDTIELVFVKRNNEFIASARNLSTNSAEVSINYKFTLQTTPDIINTGTYTMFAIGGQQKVVSFIVNTTDVKYSPLMVIGDSKTQGYDIDNYVWGDTYVGRLQKLIPDLNVHAGQADRTTDVLASLPEIKRLKPRQVLLMIGRNDVPSGLSNAQSQANYQRIVDSLTAWGIPILHGTGIYETNTSQITQYNWLYSTFSAASIIDTYKPTQDCNDCLSSDNIHPTNSGHRVTAETIIRSGKLLYMGTMSNAYLFNQNSDDLEGSFRITGFGTASTFTAKNQTLTNVTSTLSTGYFGSSLAPYSRILTKGTGQTSAGLYIGPDSTANMDSYFGISTNSAFQASSKQWLFYASQSGNTFGMYTLIAGATPSLANAATFFIGGTGAAGTNATMWVNSASQRVGVGVVNTAPERQFTNTEYNAATSTVVISEALGARSLTTTANGFGVAKEYAIWNSSGTRRVYGKQSFIATDIVNASEDGSFMLSLIKAGTEDTALHIGSTGIATFYAPPVLNALPLGTGTYTILVHSSDSSVAQVSVATLAAAMTTTNIYNTNGILTGDRDLSGGGFILSLGTGASKASTISMNASTGIQINGALQYGNATAGDADYTIPSTATVFFLPEITANRTVTFPSNGAGKIIYIHNVNSSGSFSWSISGTVEDGAGNAITTLVNDTPYMFINNGSAWVKFS